MVRTGERSVRISGGKSSKKGGGGGGRASGTPSKSSGGGGSLNPIVQREIPQWQKPITNFFNMTNKENTTITSSSSSMEELLTVPEDIAAEVTIDTDDKEITKNN